jgi:hypothetical protein
MYESDSKLIKSEYSFIQHYINILYPNIPHINYV